MKLSIYSPTRRLVAPLVWLSMVMAGFIVFGQEKTWTDSTGKHQTVAQMLKFDKKSVILRKQNGVVIRVPLTKLCDDDRGYLEDLRAGKLTNDKPPLEAAAPPVSTVPKLEPVAERSPSSAGKLTNDKPPLEAAAPLVSTVPKLEPVADKSPSSAGKLTNEKPPLEAAAPLVSTVPKLERVAERSPSLDLPIAEHSKSEYPISERSKANIPKVVQPKGVSELPGFDKKNQKPMNLVADPPLPAELKMIFPQDISASDFETITLTDTQQSDLIETGIKKPLKEKEYSLVRQTLKQLKKNWPDDPQPELIRQLEECTRSSEKLVRFSALQLLAVHDSDGSFEQIVLATFDSNFDVRWLAYESLGEMPNERGLKPLLNRFAGPDSSKIASVLETFGSQAESQVLSFLESDDKNVRLSTCSLLAKIGTESSLEELNRLAYDDLELSVRFQAKNAINKIQVRTKPQSPE